MPAKELRFDGDARDRMLRGIEILANAVKATLGPRISMPRSMRSRASPLNLSSLAGMQAPSG